MQSQGQARFDNVAIWLICKTCKICFSILHHACAWPVLGAAWLSVQISLKPLLTPDKWTNLSKKCIFCILFCILQHIIWPILHILHISICKICRIWTMHSIFLHILLHILHIVLHTTEYSLTDYAYFAYW